MTNLENLAAPEPDGSASGVWPTSVKRVDGELHVGGVGVTSLVSEFGSPVFVIDELDMRERARAWKSAMEEAFEDLAGAEVFYAGKAFLSVAVARWMAEEGLAIDTCSEGELRTALIAGVPGEKLGLHGNNKSRREIELALDSGVAHLVVDSLAELAFVEAIAAERGTTAKIDLLQRPLVLRLDADGNAGLVPDDEGFLVGGVGG